MPLRPSVCFLSVLTSFEWFGYFRVSITVITQGGISEHFRTTEQGLTCKALRGHGLYSWPVLQVLFLTGRVQHAFWSFLIKWLRDFFYFFSRNFFLLPYVNEFLQPETSTPVSRFCPEPTQNKVCDMSRCSQKF